MDMNSPPVENKNKGHKAFASQKSMAAGNETLVVILHIHPIFLDKKSNEVAEQSQESSQEDSDEEEEEDEEKVKEAIKKKHERGHKTISAEAYGKYNQKGNFVPKVIAKSNEQKQRIIQRLEKAFMFSALDDKEKNIVIDAMVEKQFA